jgi:hypothetical protein
VLVALGALLVAMAAMFAFNRSAAWLTTLVLGVLTVLSAQRRWLWLNSLSRLRRQGERDVVAV